MSAPPRLARWLLERLIAGHLSDAVLGDLEELLAGERVRSPRRARLAYWQRALGAVWHLRRRSAARLPVSRGDSPMRTLWKDLVHGLRLFVTQPGYAFAAVITLALAIGANTLIFSIVNVLVLKPLPIQQPERLAWIFVTGPNAGPDRAGVSLPEYAAYRSQAPAFARLAASRWRAVTMRADTGSERVMSHVVIGDLQGLWGLAAGRGRTLTAEDERAGAPRVVALSHRFWVVRFGAAPDIVGRDLIVDGVGHTVVGVLAPNIELGTLSEIDLWLPYIGDPTLAARTERGWRSVGRLAAGSTVGDAHAQVAAIASGLARDFPETHRDWTVRVGTTREALGGTDTWLVLSLLSTVVGLLLVLACANIMNLLIARLIGRRQELAVRSALGATRARIVRQIVGESLLLGLAGGALGLAIAAGGLRGVHAMSTEPFFQQIGFDVRVVAFATGLAFVAPLLFAVMPTLRVLRDDVQTSLNDATARSVGGGAAARGRSALIVVQVSLAVTLVVVASLVVQSVQALVQADLGYDPTALLSAQVDIPSWRLADEAEALRVRQRIVERVRAIPGVLAVTMATELPALQFPAPVMFDIVGRDTPTPRDRPSAGLTVVTTDYFEVMKIPILAGRAFAASDAAGAAAVVVLSQEAARRSWGEPARAVGALIRVAGLEGRPDMDASVIGVARNTANADLDQAPTPVIVALDEHRPTRMTHIVVRADAPATLAAQLRSAVHGVDPDLPAYQLRTVAAAFADETSSSRLLSAMFAAFAVVAVLLATAGLYGVMSYAVSQRTPEIAVRMALGASGRDIASDVVGQSVKLAVAGTAIGLAGAFALAQTMTSVLYGVTATDPSSYLGAAALALGAAVIASWLPTRRAAGIDPIQSLRQA